MSMISELVKGLRKLGNQWKHNDVAAYNLIFDAADTIEALSAKLAAHNLGKTGWIPCTNADVIRTMTDEQLYEFLSHWEQQDIDYSITFCDLCERDKREGGKGNSLGLDCDGCRKHFLKVDADSYLGLNGWLRENGFEPYREVDK